MYILLTCWVSIRDASFQPGFFYIFRVHYRKFRLNFGKQQAGFPGGGGEGVPSPRFFVRIFNPDYFFFNLINLNTKSRYIIIKISDKTLNIKFCASAQMSRNEILNYPPKRPNLSIKRVSWTNFHIFSGFTDL